MEKIQIFKHIQVPTFSMPLQLGYKAWLPARNARTQNNK